MTKQKDVKVWWSRQTPWNRRFHRSLSLAASSEGLRVTERVEASERDERVRASKRTATY